MYALASVILRLLLYLYDCSNAKEPIHCYKGEKKTCALMRTDYTWSDIEDHQHDPCLEGVGKRKNFAYNFLSAVCFSVQTATTLGYGDYGLAPNPTCFTLNAIVTAQVIISIILDYTALGLVWARISRPSQRMRTVVFSKNMTLSVVDGLPRLTFRFVNARKHQILQPTVQLFVASVRAQQDKLNPAMAGDELTISELGIDNTALPLFIGFPCTITHTITADSPLFGLSTSDMDNNGMQFLVCLEGIDSSTSNCFQARFTYIPSDIVEGHCFEGAVFVRSDGGADVDFDRLNHVIPVTCESQSLGTSASASSIGEPAVDKQPASESTSDAEARWKEKKTVNELRDLLYESERRCKAFEQRALKAEGRLRTLLSGASESEALYEGISSQRGMRDLLEASGHEPAMQRPHQQRQQQQQQHHQQHLHEQSAGPMNGSNSSTANHHLRRPSSSSSA